MAEKMYEVLKDQKYTGKHRVYLAGQKFPESELFGNKECVKMAVDGQRGAKRGDKPLPDKKPRIKLVPGSAKKDSEK